MQKVRNTSPKKSLLLIAERDVQNSAWETGHISTSRLNTLLCVHLKPINLVIF